MNQNMNTTKNVVREVSLMKFDNQMQEDIQMSEAFITSVFLALSGGFQDAYTYFTRNEVFSNAQTGNIVLMSTHLMMGEWMDVLRYLFPLLAFAGGVFLQSVSICCLNMPSVCTGGREFCLWKLSSCLPLDLCRPN